jgi:hypothetical protein
MRSRYSGHGAPPIGDRQFTQAHSTDRYAPEKGFPLAGDAGACPAFVHYNHPDRDSRPSHEDRPRITSHY